MAVSDFFVGGVRQNFNAGGEENGIRTRLMQFRGASSHPREKDGDDERKQGNKREKKEKTQT